MLGETKSTDSGLKVFRLGEYIGLRDDNGNETLSPSLCFVDIKQVADRNVFIAQCAEGYVLVDNTGKRLTDQVYEKIKEAGDGSLVVRRKRMFNVLGADLKEILRTWVNYLGEHHNGYFVMGITERRSATSSTRHLYGLAHIDGTVIFSPLFEKLEWREQGIFYAEKDNHPYLVRGDGSIIDLSFKHLPQRLEVDKRLFIEKALEWILKGMRVYYRDSEAPIDAKQVYKVGKLIRAGFFVDVSTRLQKPQTHLRFLIYSAHAAPWEAVNELVVDNPNIAHWGFCTLHCNSYYVVLDVYRKNGYTQVALLHIPPAVAKNIGESAQSVLDIVKKTPTDHGTLVEVARMLHDRNLQNKRAYDLNDKTLIESMCHPVGLTQDYEPVDLHPAELSGDAARMGAIVTRLAKDGDIDNFYTDILSDNFIWHGVENSVCEGCIYTHGMQENHRGCGRLSSEAFRRNYMRGQCEYRKPDIAVDSQAEVDAKYRWSKYQDRVNKTSHVYAKTLVKQFIDEHLGGDISKLVTFNFNTLPRDSKYINNATTLTQSRIVRALMALIFDGVWEDLNYESIEHRHFLCDTLHLTEHQFGEPEGRETFSGLKTLNATPQQVQLAFDLYDVTGTIGNFWLLPNHGEHVSMHSMHHDDYYHGFIDDFVRDMLIALCKRRGVRPQMAKILSANMSYFETYRGVRGIGRLMNALLLEGVVNRSPMKIETWQNATEDYFATLEETARFYPLALRLRAERMVTRLATKL